MLGRKSASEIRRLVTDVRFRRFLKQDDVFYPLERSFVNRNQAELLMILIDQSMRELSFKALKVGRGRQGRVKGLQMGVGHIGAGKWRGL